MFDSQRFRIRKPMRFRMWENAGMHFPKVAEFAKSPRRWIGGALLVFFIKLIDHKVYGWAVEHIEKNTEKHIDAGEADVMLVATRDLFQSSVDHPITSVFVIIGVYSVLAVIWAYLSPLIVRWRTPASTAQGVLHPPRLQFLTWHSGANRLPRVNESSTVWIAIKNAANDPVITAKNVSASLHFYDEAKTTLLIAEATNWYVKQLSAKGYDYQGWQDSLDLNPGEEQSFVFFVSGVENDHYVYKSRNALVGQLSPSHWTAKLTVTSDNVEGFECEIGFLITRELLIPDRPAFTKLRALKPRLQSI